MKCYRKLKLALSPDNKIYQDYKSFDCKQVQVPGKIYPSTGTFKQADVPLKYFENEPIFDIMQELLLRPRVFLIEPKYCYNWHRDAWRNIAFNTTLNDDPNYFVAFAADCPPEKPYKSLGYERTEEVRYEHTKFVLFNTQVPHISINMGNEPRYLLTIAHYGGPTGELKEGPASYDQFYKTVEYLKQRDLILE